MSSRSFSFWLCVALGVTLFVLVIWSQGFGWWIWLLAGLLAVCPLVTALVIVRTRRLQREAAEALRAKAVRFENTAGGEVR